MVNESSTAHSGKVLVLRAQFVDAVGDEEFNMNFYWDAIPKYRGSQQIFSQEGTTGDGVIWFYQPWGTIDDSGPYWYSHISGPGGMWTYTASLWFDYFEGFNRSITVEAYWIDKMPTVSLGWTSDGEEIGTGSLLTGPNAEFTINADIKGDAQLTDWSIFFGPLIERAPIHVEGDFSQMTSTGRSVDAIAQADLIGGDQIYVYFTTVGAGVDVDDIDVAVFAPGHKPNLGDDFGDSFAQFYTKLDGTDESICEGIFIAPTTGTYYFGIDSFGTTKPWYGDIIPSASSVVDTGKQYNVTYNTDAAGLDFPDGDVGLAAEVHSGTSLFADSKVTFTIDNKVIPEVAFSSATAALDRHVYDRSTVSSATFSWTGTDANNDTLKYIVTIDSPNAPAGNPTAFYTRNVTSTSFTWNFANKDNYPDGRWTVHVQADDQTAEGGLSTPISIFVDLVSPAYTGPTVTVTPPAQMVTTTVTATPGFTLGLFLLGIVAIVPIIISKRRK
jgi:hypothetical protein